MKNKIILFTFLIILLCNTAIAEVVSLKAPELNGKVTVAPNLVLTDWQTSMSCHFDYKGSRKHSIRYPQTIMNLTDTNDYSINIKKGSLFEALPNFRLLTCAYKILFIGKNMDLNESSVFGEIYLLGQERGEMSKEELTNMQNRDFVAKYLADKVEELNLEISPEGSIIAN